MVRASRWLWSFAESSSKSQRDRRRALVRGPNVQISPRQLLQPCYCADRGNGVDVTVLEVSRISTLSLASFGFSCSRGSARLACTLQSECANEVQDSFNHALCTDCSRSGFTRRKAVIKVDMLDIRLTVLIWKHLNWINMKLEINCLPNLQTRNDSQVRLVLACLDDGDDEKCFRTALIITMMIIAYAGQ